MQLCKSIYSCLLLVLVISFNVSAQPKPDLTCLSVLTANQVEVEWVAPAGSTSFDGFRLFYRKISDASFASVDFAPAVTSTIINAPNVSTNIYEFYLTTFINNPLTFSPESNHLETIRLTVSGNGTGIAKLEWNRQSPLDQSYRIYRSDNRSTYNLLNTTTDLKYNDTISQYCDTTTLYYRLVTGFCNALSTVDSARFIDATVPEDPLLELVTVTNGMAELSWLPGSSEDITGYIIERRDQMGRFFPYRTTGNVTSFTDNFITDNDYQGPCDNIVTYMVRAKDQCNNESAGNYLNLHNNIMITGNTVELCERKATLEWNSYNNMKPPVDRYIIEKSVNGNQFVPVLEVPSSGASTYKANDPEMLEPGVSVTYRISATNAGNLLVSHSCELILIPQPEIVTNFNVDYVTVSHNSYITLQASSLPAEVPNKVQVFRTSGDEIALVNTVAWNNSGIIEFEDREVNVGSNSYEYKLVALDSCEFEIAESQLFNSILLQIGVAEDVNVALDWTSHVGWDADLDSYLVYKYNDGILLSGYPKTVSAGLTSYNETLDATNSFDATNSIKTTYVVEAVKNDGKTSRSNEVLLPRAAEIDVPTAFRPSGVNNIFRPLVRNIDQSGYSFMIFNRWGQQVFSTTNPQMGWDGSINGDIQQGIYLYLISYIDQAGTTGTKRGTVILLD